MNKLVSALLIGGVGLGIAISGMASPAKIPELFDVAGAWDRACLRHGRGWLSLSSATGWSLPAGASRAGI